MKNILILQIKHAYLNTFLYLILFKKLYLIMSLQIFGPLISPPVRSVIMFCKLTQIPYELKYVDLSAGEQRTEAFHKINPFETVPCILHDGFNL